MKRRGFLIGADGRLRGLLVAVVAGAVSAAPGLAGWLPPGSAPRFERPGDVVLGGSFSILPFPASAAPDFVAPPAEPRSSGVSPWGFRVAQGFVLAVEEINADGRLLPNLTLGFSVRNSGDLVRGALREALGFLSRTEEPVPNFACGQGAPLAALVGDTRSALSLALARLLGLYRFPQVSYASTLPSLSDKTQFPSFLRTLASDLTSSHAVTQLVLYLRWSWVGILAQDDDFGQEAGALAARELDWAGVCVEFHLHVPSQEAPEKIGTIVGRMRGSSATAVLVFLSNSNFQLVLQRLQDFRVQGQVWVSDGLLHTALALATPSTARVLHSSVGLLRRSSRAPDLPEFLAHLHPDRTPEDPFLLRFWEATFGCVWPPRKGVRARGAWLCSGNESLRGHEHPFQDVSKVDIAYSAVYSVAHALQALLSCDPGDRGCVDPQSFQPWQLLHPLKKVHFQTPDGTEIMFDANGDLVTTFDIFQGRKTPEGLVHFVRIGTMDPHTSSGNRMTILLEKGVQVPPSVCSKSCTPGFSQIPQQGAPHCCFVCRPCPEGQFSDQRDMKRCLECPVEKYPSQARDRCLPRTETFLAFDEPLGLTLTLAALILTGLAGLAFGVFLWFQDTPVVKANNRALSYVLLASLALCALCPLLFLGRPSPATCLLRQPAFALGFTVAVSSVLAKTLTVVLAFRVTRPGHRRQACLGPNASCSVVLAASLGQSVLCGVWLGTSPPFPDRDMASEPGRVLLICQEGSDLAFSCMLGSLGLLAVGTFCVAFLARALPDAFNETRLLTFSMLLVCSVWTAFLPLYHSARGTATVAVEVFSILASTAGLLGGIFIPKCYLILLRPEHNTPAWLRPGTRVRKAARGCFCTRAILTYGQVSNQLSAKTGAWQSHALRSLDLDGWGRKVLPAGLDTDGSTSNSLNKHNREYRKKRHLVRAAILRRGSRPHGDAAYSSPRLGADAKAPKGATYEPIAPPTVHVSCPGHVRRLNRGGGT
ncbi:vomeronasal type-2 receptor 26-like [Ctenodactylus gundi]